MSVRLVQARSIDDWRHARRLIEEYAASLDIDLSFQNFSQELAHLASDYGPPMGCLLLAEEEGDYLGCVGLRQFSPGVGEVKRLYTVPAARGRRVGRLLADGIVAQARQLGYAQLLLDTLPSMQQAQALYVSMGFKETPAYRFNPVPGTVFLALTL
ncbi:MAG: GNAT family N-acetyltransferase [Steroidobacterales bacterium]